MVYHRVNTPMVESTTSRFSFPATFSPDQSDGGFVFTVAGSARSLTQGDSMEQALAEAADCLEEAML
ncbi:MAG: hypothetical protein F6K65_42150 [Moorea sp. SIO3C2]|nr:hypothetical protein [Moorena sp. SIO3C2]